MTGNHSCLSTGAHDLSLFGALEYRPNEHACGVYFLLRRRRVVYVGHSNSLRTRMASHRATKRFDRVLCFPLAPSMAQLGLLLERYFTWKYRPWRNRCARRKFKLPFSRVNLEAMLVLGLVELHRTKSGDVWRRAR